MALNKILVNEYIFMRYDTYICTCILDLYGQKRKQQKIMTNYHDI